MKTGSLAKSAKLIERHFKGVSNHWRILLLLTIAKHPNSSLESLAEMLGGNIKTISEHTRRLLQAGLIAKNYQGREVLHVLTPYGKRFHAFITTFQHS
jgi:DNA-binding MarR family transcriptional regulator